MANKINVLECGPRDGWQNLKQMLTFEQKLDLIDRLFDAGVTQMEVTSFVSPKAIPQMADAADLAKACIEKYPNAVLYALAPNFRGVENAFNAGIRNISYVISVSESHNKANIRRTHEESLEELQKIMDTYPQMNICVAPAALCPASPRCPPAARWLWRHLQLRSPTAPRRTRTRRSCSCSSTPALRS